MWFTLHDWVGRYRNFSDTEIVMSVVKLNEQFAVFIGRAMTPGLVGPPGVLGRDKLLPRPRSPHRPLHPPRLELLFTVFVILKTFFNVMARAMLSR